ncbi:DNA/RNA nuclease SfsA [Rhizobiaceae bacterium BDR2-2]|uniref:Sugar fermentation stimulation protein homolog n=1 Tax=Ectorhizobium quercum TaxID=2965071 RepID=A0AAE3N1J1_9HYPH|nr:DNA/RNA nuclease SfsA [Ectorhizobium quercum]MCX8997590.1 DNA/RNA nuclease SfsA [Ectorhizobium quercum]
MIFDPPLIAATLVRRYKRFLFDAVLEDGTPITGFCPNTGSMRGLTEPGSRIWLSQHDEGPARKYRYRFELIEVGGIVAGINSGMANRFAEEALVAGLVPGLEGYDILRREQKYGRQSRIDFLLSGNGLPDAYVEVKNVHFIRSAGLAEFPDTATARGARHLKELGDMVEAGHRAVMLYLIQRPDCDRFAVAGDLDPVYAAAYDRALSRGVEVRAVKCAITPREIRAEATVAMDDRARSG